MTRSLALLTPLAPLTLVVLLAGCFEAGEDDDEIGSATDDTTADTTGESDTSTDTNESSTTADDTDETTADDTTSEDTDDTTSEESEETGPDCEAPEMACGQDCADLDSDPNHCGACDHSCLGGGCDSGSCEVVELAINKGRLFMVQVDAEYLYYGGDGVDVGRLNLDGTNDTTLVPAGVDPQQREYCYEWAITPDAVVWGNDWLQGGVRGCVLPDCAGGVQTFVPGMTMYAMTFNRFNDTLYWNQGTNIHRRTWPGGTPTVHLLNANNPRTLTADDGSVYWVSYVGQEDFHVRKNSLAGGPFVDLVTNRPIMGDLEVGPDNVYWAEGTQIYSAPLPNGSGGNPPTQFGDGGLTIRYMAIDDTHLYWTAAMGAGTGAVQRCPLAGCEGAPELLSNVSQPWGITLDDVAVYWVTETGAIYKVAK